MRIPADRVDSDAMFSVILCFSFPGSAYLLQSLACIAHLAAVCIHMSSPASHDMCGACACKDIGSAWVGL